MPVVRQRQQRTSETPNGVMTTLASPTLGGAGIAIWRVSMPPGGQGPLHTFDGEQVWTVTAGGARVELGADEVDLRTGDAAVLPADVLRRMTADPAEGLQAVVAAPAGVRARLPDGTNRGVPPWIV